MVEQMPLGYSPYFLRITVNNIKKSIFLNLISVGIIATSFLIFTGFLMFIINLNGVLKKVADKIQVNVFLNEDLSAKEISDFQQKLSAFMEIESMTFISKEDALRDLKNVFRGKENLFDELPANPLPPSFEIKLKSGHLNSRAMGQFADKISRLAEVDEVGYGREWVKRLANFVSMIKLTGIILGGLLLLTVIFIVSNTIRLTIHTKQEEIEIMKLVGATDYFIKIPFIIEGGLQGLLGTLLSLGTLFLLFRFFASRAASCFGISLNSFFFNFLSPHMIAGIIIGGIALGVFGSIISLEKFLKT